MTLTARLATHALNASLTLCEQGETRQDGEPRQLLARLESLTKAVGENLSVLFGEQPDDDDPIRQLMAGGGRK